MVDCAKCGHANPEGSNFCSHCGASLTSHASLSDTTRVIIFPEEEARSIELSAEDADALQELPAGNALLIVTRGPDVGARYRLDKEVVTAGRSPKSDIFLDDITVSRHHAQFVMKDHSVSIVDNRSLNGTYVNRTLVDHEAILRPGDEVQIGKFRMLFFVSERGLS